MKDIKAYIVPYALGAAVILTGMAAHASSMAEERGLLLARANCASCHAVQGAAASPDSAAPRFQDLQRTYPDRTMEEIVAEGLMVDHPLMPVFTIDPGDLQDVLAYLKSIQSRPRPARDR
jgi:cytochrome c